MTPSDPRFPPAGFRYFIDNGAWTAYQKGIENDLAAFEKYLSKYGECADFVVIPDIVQGGMKSLDLSVSWIGRVSRYGDALIPVQDGMTAADLTPLLELFDVGLFVGGSTEWKIKTLPIWGNLAKRHGCHLHVGRVNSVKRIALCSLAGVDSIDGTAAIFDPSVLSRLDNAVRQPALFLDSAMVSGSEAQK